jgi:hypothetical protein
MISALEGYANGPRAVYTVRCAELAHTLHVLQKKSPSRIRTACGDIDLVERRRNAPLEAGPTTAASSEIPLRCSVEASTASIWRGKKWDSF